MKFVETFNVVQSTIDEINEHIIAHGNGMKKEYFVGLLDSSSKDLFKDVKEDYVFVNCKYKAIITVDNIGFTSGYFPIRHLKFKSEEIEEYFKSVKDTYIDLEISINDLTETGDLGLVREQLSKFHDIRFIGGMKLNGFDHLKYLKEINAKYPEMDSGFRLDVQKTESKLLVNVTFIYDGITLAVLTLNTDLIPGIVGNIQNDIENGLITINRTN